VPLDLREVERHAKRYVEIEADTTVRRVRFVKRFTLFGREDILLSVTTTDTQDPDWWVIGGSTPMNLYSKKQFPESHMAYSFHQGLMLQLLDRQYREDRTAPATIGYDAFISHAAEDKESLVKPLAKHLSRMGYRVWYDEFELTVGDSLRQSIDRGLATSRYGVVILSPAFFAKKWPQYELNGLTAREIDGQKVVLPIWHGVSKSDVTQYSPSLADKVALSTEKLTVRKIAQQLAQVFDAR
jgi:TIR domain-containing protein